MRIIIPSYHRAKTISSHKLFEKYDYTIFVHTEEERSEYLQANPDISPEKLVTTNAPAGVANQRQWIQDNFLKKDEWFISLDDNIQEIHAVPEPHYFADELPVKTDKSMKALFETVCSPERFIEICEELAQKGEKEGAYNIGFGTTPNFFFRAKKYRYVGYVISKACVRKNVGTPFALDAQSMEDYAYTAETLLRYGKVIVNNFVFPVAKHYEKGGIGTYEERLPRKIRDSETLMQRYPMLFRHPKKTGTDPLGELAIRFTSLKQVEKWRAFMRTRKN